MVRPGGGGYRPGAGAIAGGYGGARPLTVTPGNRFNNNYRYGRGYWRGGRWWYGAAAAPLIYPWFGDGYDYNTYYPGYDYDYYSGSPAYAYPAEEYYPAQSYSYGGQAGNYCATPQKTCQLYDPAPVGVGCSCRAPGGEGRYRGAVVP